jgi:hypothetical protein
VTGTALQPVTMTGVSVERGLVVRPGRRCDATLRDASTSQSATRSAASTYVSPAAMLLDRYERDGAERRRRTGCTSRPAPRAWTGVHVDQQRTTSIGVLVDAAGSADAHQLHAPQQRRLRSSFEPDARRSRARPHQLLDQRQRLATASARSPPAVPPHRHDHQLDHHQPILRRRSRRCLDRHHHLLRRLEQLVGQLLLRHRPAQRHQLEPALRLRHQPPPHLELARALRRERRRRSRRACPTSAIRPRPPRHALDPHHARARRQSRTPSPATSPSRPASR